MNNPATLHTYLEAADVVLLLRGVEYRYEPYLDKAMFPDEPREDIRAKLETAKIIFFYSAGYDEWTDLLVELHLESPLPVKLFLIGGSDLILTPTYMEVYEAFFTKTKFWIINFIGRTDQCQVLPLLFNWDGTKDFPRTERRNLVGIPFARINSIPRMEFFGELKTLPALHPLLMREMENADYYKSLTSLFFCVCPMGNGPDTFRFWEALVCGAIPIVIAHPFYATLMEQYPGLPVIVIEQLADLEALLPQLTTDYYAEIMKKAQLDVLWEPHWKNLLQAYKDHSSM